MEKRSRPTLRIGRIPMRLRLRVREEAERQGHTIRTFLQACMLAISDTMLVEASVRALWHGGDSSNQVAHRTLAIAAIVLQAEGWPRSNDDGSVVLGDPQDGRTYLYWWEPVLQEYAEATMEPLDDDEDLEYANRVA